MENFTYYKAEVEISPQRYPARIHQGIGMIEGIKTVKEIAKIRKAKNVEIISKEEFENLRRKITEDTAARD